MDDRPSSAGKDHIGLSAALRDDVGGHLSGLTTYRTTNGDAWIRWCANTLASSAIHARATSTAFGRLREEWTQQLDQRRADPTARSLADHLLAHPVMTTTQAANQLGIDTALAHETLVSLARDSIVTQVETSPDNQIKPVNARQPQQRWIAHDVMSLTAKRTGPAIE